MAFHDVIFPTAIARGASGGPRRKTDIVTFGSGHEQRNAKWAMSRRSYNVAYGIKTLDDLYAVQTFFEERQGRLHGFRFCDPFDHKSCAPSVSPTAFDQAIGVGDGTTASFKLIKIIGVGSEAQQRPIVLPRASSILVGVGGEELALGTDFVWDNETKAIVFEVNAIPQDGAQITAGFHFDVPVRFDVDEIVTSLSHFEAGEIPSIPLVEVLA